MAHNAAADVRPFVAADLDQLVQLSLAAWTPIFTSFRAVLGSQLYSRLYPDWRRSQAAAVRELCANPDAAVLVAEVDGSVVGFSALLINDDEDRSGELDMIAVAPSHQRRGIASVLISASEQLMQMRGCTLAVIATGGDSGHAPARAAYDAAGYTALPLVRYYKTLRPLIDGEAENQGRAARMADN